ncbi:hypothetical protein GWK47_052301 [Chionoecetes opilio]|uniref:Uncharacterized protein n=1 Tax=Chionoecetes opilio TaxID=41210 RepID=A0A8J4YBX9_CHIOP|nr:hypothetical protein GWK47_052301 [Chionoecetes opilio]
MPIATPPYTVTWLLPTSSSVTPLLVSPLPSPPRLRQSPLYPILILLSSPDREVSVIVWSLRRSSTSPHEEPSAGVRGGRAAAAVAPYATCGRYHLGQRTIPALPELVWACAPSLTFVTNMLPAITGTITE